MWRRPFGSAPQNVSGVIVLLFKTLEMCLCFSSEQSCDWKTKHVEMCKDERSRGKRIFTFNYFWQENNTERHVRCLRWLSFSNSVHGKKKKGKTNRKLNQRSHSLSPWSSSLQHVVSSSSSSSHPPCDATHRHVVCRARLSVSLHKTKARWST